MNRRTITSVAIIAALFGTAAPLHAQSREQLQIMSELRIMHEQMQMQAVANEKLQAQLTAALKAITDRIEASDTTMRKSLADQKVIVDTLATDLRIIKQNLQDSNTRLRTLTDEVDARGNAISLGGGPQPSAVEPPAGADPGTPSPSVTKSGLTPGRLYDQAWAEYTGGNLAGAISGFERYLAEFPRGAKAADAQFYIGESHSRMKRLPEAIAAFTAVVKNHADSTVAPDAYYRLGEAQRSLGQIDEARRSWETAVSRYPDSNGGILAKQRLEGLPPAAAPRQP